MSDAEQIYWDDLNDGDEFHTVGRTVTESDVVSFAGLSGDYNQLHTDAHFAAETPYGERIAHGLLVLAITSGLSTRQRSYQAMAPSIMGLLGLQCKWPGHTRIGDTISITIRVQSKKETSKPDRGVVVLERIAADQDGRIVMESEWTLLLRRRT